jgi:FG-GAP-like repeat
MYWGMRVRPCLSALLVGGLLVVAAPAGADLFLAPTGVVADTATLAMESADFNGDGRPDIVLLGNASGIGSNGRPPEVMTVLLSLGDGTFGPPTSTNVTSAVAHLSAVDLNGDGRADVVATGAGLATVFWGNGAGGFFATSAVNLSGATNADFSAVADVNGDGRPDLLFSDRDGGRVIVVLAGAPDPKDLHSRPTFSGTALASPTDPLPGMLRIADMNSDGRADLVLLTGDFLHAGVQVLYGDGKGQFRPGPSLALGDSRAAASLAVADLTGDGRPDIVTANSQSNTVTVIRNDSAGLSLTFDSGFVAYPTSVRLADVNGDGLLDVIVGTKEAPSVAVVLGNGDGTLRPPQTYPGAQTQNGSVAVADFDGDGLPDLSTGGSDSLSIALLRHAPALRVDAGPDQAVTTAGAADIRLSATIVYSDPQVSLRWREGRHILGTSASILLPVSIGEHVITVEATASDGAFASDTVKVTVSGSFASQTSVDSLAAKLDGLGAPAQEGTVKALLGDVTNQGILTSALLTFVQGQLDATVGSRASSKDLSAAVLDLKTAGLTQANLDGLSAGIGAAVAGARKDLMRAAIESALAHGDTVAFFMAPAAAGGVLETVRGIVAATIAGRHVPDRTARRAQALLSRGDAELAAGRTDDAYRDFVDAYQTVVRQ